ncbi:YfhO family protein [Bacillus sp. OK048]|uniref:YfhO family protein n=1 Tax=Bacillus sp. OK048 TaxID=1882761 RepID=UPI0008838C5B|nr:YfhO family protein [Bacillus sp. OK048]SDM69933.1 Uncharacterized membrane protein YfhO [Bacillus sp. OK048]
MEKRCFLKDRYFWILFVLMTIVSGVVFYDFILNKRLFIFYDIGGDTRQSYWPMYHYIVEQIREGTFNTWSFQMGLGTSTFTLYSFLFDPFIILFLFFPAKYLPYCLLIGAIIKIYISGILIYFYFNLLAIKRYPAVIASLVWAFSGYMMLWGQHYWFATMIVLFTFIMLALEMWIRGKNKLLFPISIALMGINSPYFLFMISIFIFFYLVFHYFFSEDSFTIKSFMLHLSRFFGAYFLGLGASAMVFLPVSYLILSSPRTSGSFYNGSILQLGNYLEYISIFLRYFSNNTLGVGLSYFGTINYYEGPMLSSSLLFIIALPQMLFVKTKLKIKIGFLLILAISIGLLIFPFFSALFSAFSSYNYRWNFLLVFLNVVTIGYMLHFFSNQRRFSYLGLGISAIVVITGWYYSYKILIFQNMIPVSYLEDHYMKKMAIMIGTFLFIYAIIFIALRKNIRLQLFLIMSMVSLELIAINYPTVNQRLTVPVDVQAKREGYFDYSNEAINYIKSHDKTLFRIDKNFDSYSYNDSLIQNFYGIKSYNSLNHPSYINFLRELDTGNTSYQLAGGFNQRPILRDLTGVKYVLAKNEQVPSEYIKLKTFGDIHVYENPNVLPLGFTYDSFINEEEFRKLMPFEKDQVFLKAAVVDKTKQVKVRSELTTSSGSPININDFTMLNAEMKNLTNNQDFELITSSGDPGMSIRLPDNTHSWKIEFEIEAPSKTNAQIFLSTEADIFNPEDSYMFEVSDTPIKVAYELNNMNLNGIRLDPGMVPGKYFIKNLKITQVEKSEKQDTGVSEKVEIQEFSNTKISGTVDVDKKKLLFFSIPFDQGWKMKIDGKKVDTMRVNMGFTGTFIPKGQHTVELEFHQPYLKIGLFISVICWSVLLWKLRNSRNKSILKMDR